MIFTGRFSESIDFPAKFICCMEFNCIKKYEVRYSFPGEKFLKSNIASTFFEKNISLILFIEGGQYLTVVSRFG